MKLIGLAIVIVLVTLAARGLYERAPKQRARRHTRELLSVCHGDQMLAERLMFAEVKRSPGLSLGAAAQRARKRLERDRGR